MEARSFQRRPGEHNIRFCAVPRFRNSGIAVTCIRADPLLRKVGFDPSRPYVFTHVRLCAEVVLRFDALAQFRRYGSLPGFAHADRFASLARAARRQPRPAPKKNGTVLGV